MAMLLAGGVGLAGLGAAAYLGSRSTELKINNSRKPGFCATTVPQLDEVIEKVAKNAQAWKDLPNAEKLAILQEMHAILKDIQDEVGTKGDELRKYTGSVSEGMGFVLSIVPTASYLKGLIETYSSLVANKKPADVIARRKVGATEVVQTHPRPGMWEKITNGMVIELWGTDGAAMTQSGPSGSGVCGVLCPGNFEGPIDVFHKMFIEQNVVVCKNHPINAHCTDILHAKVLAPLIERGFAGLCTGGIDISTRLIHHPLIDNWMMTGGCATFDAIVWGGAAGKKAGKMVLNKKCHAELGAASPYIITPGDWSDAEVTYQAKMLLGLKTFNSGHICASPQTVFVDSSWPKAKAFVAAIKQAAKETPLTRPYYPGAEDRTAAVESKYPHAEKISGLVLVPDLDDAKDGEYFIRTESFAGALGIKFLDGNNDAATFLDKAVSFCNETCFGSLSCSVIIDPKAQAALGPKFDSDVLGKLRWGSIGVNTWGGMGASNPYGIWGAHKDAHTAKDIQSGIGFMGNCLFVDNVKKSVLYGKWSDPGPLALFTQSSKTKAIGRAFGNMAVNGGVRDLLCLVKAIALGKY